MYKPLQDITIINNFSKGECSHRFILRDDVEGKNNCVISAENTVPYLYGGLYKRPGIINSQLLPESDITFKIFTYNETMIAIYFEKIFFVDIVTKQTYEIKYKLFENIQIFKENIKNIVACGTNIGLCITHRLIYPKIIRKANIKNAAQWSITNIYISKQAYVPINISNRDELVEIKNATTGYVDIILSFEDSVVADSYYVDFVFLLKNNNGAQYFEKMGGGVFFISNIESIRKADQSLIITAKTISEPTFKQDKYSGTAFGWRREMFLFDNPSCVLFHEGRLIFGANENNENILYFSKINDYSDFEALSGESNSAFFAKLTSEPGEIITGLVSGLALQVFTNKHVYVMQNSGYIPLASDTFALNKSAHNGSYNFFCKNKNNETLYIGEDSNLYCLQKKGATTFEALNLSLLCNKKNIINMDSGAYYYSYIPNDNENSKKIEYIIAVYDDGTCGVIQYNTEINKLCWSTFTTQLGKFKQVLYINDEFYFIIENDHKGSQLYKLDIKSKNDEGFAINVNISTLPLLPFRYMPTGEISKTQGLPFVHVIFEGDSSFFINDVSISDYEITKVYNDIKLVKLSLSSGWSQIININLKYSGDKDFKLYGLIMPIVRT